ncbi:MAG: flagellar export protein FliJ [Bdellovibrionales bacterium]|nr:flagellar export protein FliJ [Bdellovibrionales bacterium]
MKKFKFRLQRVLDYRNSVKKDKERELALKNALLHAAEHRLEEIIDEQDGVELPTNGEMTMAELQLTREYQQYLQDALVEQRLTVLEAASAVEAARDAYIEKAIEAETLETLRKKKQLEHRDERRREERKELNDLTVQRHRFKKNPGDES